MGSMRKWQHERRVKATGQRTSVTDVISFEPRLPLPGLDRVALAIVQRLFRHRHRRLARYFSPKPW